MPTPTNLLMQTRVERLLAMMREPDREFKYGEREQYRVKGEHYTVDGKWFYLRLVPYMGRKTISVFARHLDVEVISAVLGQNNPYGAKELFRLRDQREPADLGDLWIE